MERGQTEEEIILAFMVSEKHAEDAANTNFSLGKLHRRPYLPRAQLMFWRRGCGQQRERHLIRHKLPSTTAAGISSQRRWDASRRINC